MATPPSDNGSEEIKISLDDGAELELHEVEVDADGRPINFTIEGVIKNVDSNVLDKLAGTAVEPTAVWFRRVSDDE